MALKRFLIVIALLNLAAFVAMADSDEKHDEDHTAPAPSPEGEEGEPELWTFKLHGALMWIGFGVLMPLAVISSHGLQKHTKSVWFHIHWVLQVASVAFIVPGFAISVHYFDAWNEYLHVRVGTVVFILALANFLWAFIRPKKGSFFRTVWYIVHSLIGTGVIPLGWFAIFTGFDLYEDEVHEKIQNLKIIFAILVAILSSIYFLSGRWDHIREQSKSEVVSSEGTEKI